MTGQNDFILQFDNVSYSYEDEGENAANEAALNNVSFSLKRGEFLAVLGSNGSGKSTLAKLSNSIYVPSSGKVFACGMDTSDPENEYRIKKRIGVVFQNPDNQIVASIVEEDVAFGPENLSVPPAEIRERVDTALKNVGMYDYRAHETHKLSGGQKQRIAIAGILAMQPECIVLDEPTAMLDPSGRKDVISAVKRLNKEQGMSVILITHFMDEAALADRILVMNDSRVEAFGTPAEIFSDEALLKRCSLALPDTAALILEMKKNGVKLPFSALTPEEFTEKFTAFCSSSK